MLTKELGAALAALLSGDATVDTSGHVTVPGLANKADLTADNTLNGAQTIVNGTGLTLKSSGTSTGFTVQDRATAAGHQVNFISNAPVSAAGAVMNIFASASSATSKNASQISLWTVPPTAVSAVQGAIRGIAGSTGEELHLLTQQFGDGSLTAGDILFKPNSVETFRVTRTGANLTGTLSVNGTQVLGARKTGWTASTGTATRTGFATSTATAQQVAEALKALIDDLISHGVIGA